VRRTVIGIPVWTIAVIAALVGGTACGARAEQSVDLDLRIIHKPGLISIGISDFDLVKARFSALNGTFVFTDNIGAEVGSYDVDYTLPVARSHVLFKKKAGSQYASVAVTLVDGEATVFEKSLPIPPVTQPARFPSTTQKATVVAGASGEPIDAAIRSLRIPDVARAPVEEIKAAARKVTDKEIYRQVLCDINFPVHGSSDRSFVGRQTANPDDPKKKSLYISLRSQFFDPKTGKYDRQCKYLAEIAFDESWLRPALAAEGDTRVSVPPEYLRIHATDKKVKYRGSFDFGMSHMTGYQRGGLMQVHSTVSQDREGNIYFSIPYRGCIRFNVHKAEFEAPPVELFHEFLAELAPKSADLPYGREIKSVDIDTGSHVYCHPDHDRVFIALPRYAFFSKTWLCNAAVMSIPTRHWDAPEAFRKEMRLNAASWASADHPLWDTWVQPGDMTRKLLGMDGDGDRVWMVSYHRNYFWVMDLNKDGSTKRLKRIDTFKGKPIVEFGYRGRRILLNRANDEPTTLGIVVPIRLKGEKDMRLTFLRKDAYELTEEIPKYWSGPPWHYRNVGVVRGETQYGAKTMNKDWINGYLDWSRKGIKPGKVTVYYDVIGALRREPTRYKFILDRIAKYSLAPIFQATAVPDAANRVIGIAEYGYYQSFYTYKPGTRTVRKEPLLLDTGQGGSRLGVTAGIGPYDHMWYRDGDMLYLYYIGYTGITRLLYSVGGKPFERFKTERLNRRLRLKNLDTPGASYIKWYGSFNPGLDGKMLCTGRNVANRGGKPYDNGLIYFDAKKFGAQYKLARMSRSYNTGSMAWRVLLGKAAEAGAMAQEIYLGGSHNAEYAPMLPPDQRPASTEAKIFVYEDSKPKGVRDRYAFTFKPDMITFKEIVFAPDQIHLLIVMLADAQTSCIASLDVTAGRFADVRKIPHPLAIFVRGGGRIIRTPDERLMFMAYGKDGQSATFAEIKVAADGKLSFKPHLTIVSGDKRALADRVVYAFIPDRIRNDGSCDLMLGSPGVRGATPETRLRLIPDFLPPRGPAKQAVGQN